MKKCVEVLLRTMLPSTTALLRAELDSGVFAVSPLTAGLPVTSCHVMVLSVVLEPCVPTFHTGSVVACVVPAIMQIHTRSLVTAGAASCRTRLPTALTAPVDQTGTAK